MGDRYAQVHMSIWTDAHFCALPRRAQLAYFLILSQPDITFAGTLPYIPKRWARMSGDASVAEVEEAVGILERERFVFVDRSTDELMVRTFVKANKIYEQKQLRKALVRDYHAVLSTDLRRKFHAEQTDDVKALVGSPPEASPEGLPYGLRDASVTKDLDLDLDLYAEPSSSLVASSGPVSDEPVDDDERINEAIRALARRDLAAVTAAKGERADPQAWLETAIHRRWERHVAQAERALRAHPDWTAERLADHLEKPEPTTPRVEEPAAYRCGDCGSSGPHYLTCPQHPMNQPAEAS